MPDTSRQSSRFAGPAEIAAHLRISARILRAFLEPRGIAFNRAGRCEWALLWRALWGIHNVPPERFAAMRRPLMTLEEVAGTLGVHPRTIRRAGDRTCPRYRLPRHLDLGPNRRRYLPLTVEPWLVGAAPEPWLLPMQVIRPGALGLAPRIPQTMEGGR